MITYQYTAQSRDGAKVNGVVEATDEYNAIAKIKAECPIILKIKPVKEKNLGLLGKEIGGKKLDFKALSLMCSQFSIILAAGIPVARCMEMIAGQTEDKKIKKMLQKSAEDVQQGNGVADSMLKNCKELPTTFVETVRAGEESGTLDNSFKSLESYYEKSYKLKQKVGQALTYPIFVVIVAVVVVIVVMVKVVPTLTSTFADLGGDMPGITKVLIGMSYFFRNYILLIIAAIAGLIIAFKVYTHTEKGRLKWSTIKLKMPMFGKIGLLSGASQFANTMSALLKAGLPVGRALRITGKSLDNYRLGTEVENMMGLIEEGRQLGDCLRKADIFPTTLNEMCAIGEETGELEGTLDTIGNYYDNEADNATKKALGKLEPMIMCVMAVFAGFIVLAIYIPIFQMYGMM